MRLRKINVEWRRRLRSLERFEFDQSKALNKEKDCEKTFVFTQETYASIGTLSTHQVKNKNNNNLLRLVGILSYQTNLETYLEIIQLLINMIYVDIISAGDPSHRYGGRAAKHQQARVHQFLNLG